MAATSDVRLRNRSWRRTLLLTGLLGLALGVAVAADDEVPLVSKAIAVTFLPVWFSSMVWGPMLLGLPAAQPWLAITEQGLDYGGRTFVPWTVVAEIARHRVGLGSSKRSAFVLDGWSPHGRASRYLYKRAAPLAHIEPRWRKLGVPEAVAHWAPHVTINDA